MNGIEATRRIVESRPATNVVILSMHNDESYVLQSLRAGARGYLLKDSPRAEVLEAVRTAAAGRPYMSRKVSRLLQEEYVDQLRTRNLDDSWDLLTDRERRSCNCWRKGGKTKKWRLC